MLNNSKTIEKTYILENDSVIKKNRKHRQGGFRFTII